MHTRELKVGDWIRDEEGDHGRVVETNDHYFAVKYDDPDWPEPVCYEHCEDNGDFFERYEPELRLTRDGRSYSVKQAVDTIIYPPHTHFTCEERLNEVVALLNLLIDNLPKKAQLNVLRHAGGFEEA
ncbi:hypothetical protein KC887_02965 [Candidatus Kaiserbacteria bacterium]|nr:hypothetical protein [Candidatus Kaiserbacteria bacterium]